MACLLIDALPYVRLAIHRIVSSYVMVGAGSGTQKTLYNLRFGNVTTAKRHTDGQDGQGSAAKRARTGEHAATPDGQQAGQGEGEQPFVGQGTTTDPTELRPVTKTAFLQAYRVEGVDDVYYQPDWIPATLAHQWRRELDGLLQWYRPTLKVYGREIRQSRSIAAFSTAPGLALKYSGHQVTMHSPFPPLLERIAARLATEDCLGVGVKFNHAMLNRYDDGSVYIGKHSDNAENKVIVTVSLGAERAWVMEEKGRGLGDKKGHRGQKKKHKWTLANGSLLVMQGDVQRCYTHEIPKQATVKQPRISITFRQLVY